MSERILRLFVSTSLIDGDLDRALEVGKELEIRYHKRRNVQKFHATQLLIIFIAYLKLWSIKKAKSIAMHRLNSWYSRQTDDIQTSDIHGESREVIIRQLFLLEPGERFQLNENDHQVLREFAQNQEKMVKMEDHPLYQDLGFFMSLQRIPEFKLKGWRFLTFFEDFFVEKLLRADEISVASLAEQINRKFMVSLLNVTQFRQIIDESLKIVKINEHLDVRLIDGETIIFIDGKEFRQCTYILMINPHEHDYHHQINSIDEAQKFLSHGLERGGVSPSELGISAKEEFWAHCSNLQAWVEHDYDTRLLHSNLSFPLLKALARFDPLAKMRLQEEIVSRISARYFPVIMYLMTEEYYICLIPKQLEFLLEVLHEILAEKLDDPSCSHEAENVEFFIQEIMDYIDLHIE